MFLLRFVLHLLDFVVYSFDFCLFFQIFSKESQEQGSHYFFTMKIEDDIFDQNMTLLIPGTAVTSASPSVKLYAGPLKNTLW